MVARKSFTFSAGEDKTISLVYKQRTGVDQPVAVDLTGYTARMDIVDPDGTKLVTLDNEISLGSDGSISVTISREHSLPEGALYEAMSDTTPQTVFNYDLFLRDTADHQRPLIQGQLQVKRSYTQWQ